LSRERFGRNENRKITMRPGRDGRWYWQALRRRPDQIARPEVLRRLFGTYVGRSGYEHAKRLSKRVLGHHHI
jgi:hypothetical protein